MTVCKEAYHLFHMLKLTTYIPLFFILTSFLESGCITNYILPNGKSLELKVYDDTLAGSMSRNLFQGISIETIVKQREDLLAPGREEVYSICALVENLVVGVCTGVRGRWFGERHRIEFVQAVVHEGFRSLGIARLMMKEIASHFKAYGVEIAEISVESDNHDAFLAYTKIGFIQYGILRSGLKYDDAYSDEILLAMPLSELLNM
ncbi:MAG: GNAT family N-acetyltransferase [Candidatus Thorarchaeota archaeon]